MYQGCNSRGRVFQTFQLSTFHTSRARSLRNLLVSGNECGRVFPAGVGPGSPSRDAANWLPSRFSLSVETRRRYGWLRMTVFPGARLFPSPNLVPFGRVAARERQGALSLHTSRARSLRNLLVSGNECGRVFPAGVGPGSPSRDAANWLPSRFSLSVETRRRYGWLRMTVFPGARLFPSPNLVPFGRVAARERQGALSRRAW